MQRTFLLGATAAAAGLFVPAAATAQVSATIDNHGPTVGVVDGKGFAPITPADILTPTLGGLGPNAATLFPVAPISILTSGGFGPPGPGLGLATHGFCIGAPGGAPCPSEVDAMSYGLDHWWQPGPTPPGTVWFSVDEYAGGIPSAIPSAAEVFTEGTLGLNTEAAGDAFIDLGIPFPPPLPPFAIPPNNTGAMDGNGLMNAAGVAYPGIGLIEPAPAGPIPPDFGDNLDGMDVDTPAAVYPVYWSMDSGWPDPINGFPWNATGPVNGFSGGDVVVTVLPGAGPAPYAAAPLLGLDFFGFDTDDLDALILWENAFPGYQPSTTPFDWTAAGGPDMLFFSVRRGSAVIGAPDSMFGIPIEPGDILMPPVAGGVSPFPAIWIAAENLGLATLRSGTVVGSNWGDELDALDAVSSQPIDCNGNGLADAAEIALGLVPDANSNGIPDDCETIIDCNGNGIADAIDIATGVSADCDGDGVPDECEPDCNGNGVADDCDILFGGATDLNADGVPDDCQVLASSTCFCGSAAPAPCANFDPAAGCMNSTGGGALLTTAGTSSIVNDDLFLTMGPVAPGQFGVFFMGSALIGPFPFGDGLRCVGGTGVWRFPLGSSGAGTTISFGPVVSYANTSFGAGTIAPFSTWHFQGWYRDPAGPCGSSFNLTQAESITFTP